MEYAGSLAIYLLEKTGSIFGVWAGRLSAAAQRALFGRYIGKGLIIIDGLNETICNRVKVCFGHDYDDRNIVKWRNL